MVFTATPSHRRGLKTALFVVLCGCFIVWATSAKFAGFGAPKTSGAVPPLSGFSALAAPSDDPRAWEHLAEAQRKTLFPLRALWPTLDDASKQRWLGVAGQLQILSPNETTRVQARMVAWAKLSTKERAEARLQYQIAKRVPAGTRKEQWAKYQSNASSAAQRKRPEARLSMVGPATVQAAPGATTMLLSQLPTVASVN